MSTCISRWSTPIVMLTMSIISMSMTKTSPGAFPIAMRINITRSVTTTRIFRIFIIDTGTERLRDRLSPKDAVTP